MLSILTLSVSCPHLPSLKDIPGESEGRRPASRRLSASAHQIQSSMQTHLILSAAGLPFSLSASRWWQCRATGWSPMPGAYLSVVLWTSIPVPLDVKGAARGGPAIFASSLHRPCHPETVAGSCIRTQNSSLPGRGHMCTCARCSNRQHSSDMHVPTHGFMSLPSVCEHKNVREYMCACTYKHKLMNVRLCTSVHMYMATFSQAHSHMNLPAVLVCTHERVQHVHTLICRHVYTGVHMHVHVRQTCTHVQNCTIHVQAHKLIFAPGEREETRGGERKERKEEVERRGKNSARGPGSQRMQDRQSRQHLRDALSPIPHRPVPPNNCQTLPFYTLGAVVSCRGLCSSPGAIMGGVQGHVQVQIQEHVQVQLRLHQHWRSTKSPMRLVQNPSASFSKAALEGVVRERGYCSTVGVGCALTPLPSVQS